MEGTLSLWPCLTCTSSVSREGSDLAGAASEELVPAWPLQLYAGVEGFSVPWSPNNFLSGFLGHQEGPMCSASGSQDGYGPSREAAPRVSLCSSPTPPHHGSLQPPRQCCFLDWVGEAGADSQGWRKMCYISLKKRWLACHVNRNQIRGQPQRQCSYS